MCPDAKQNEDAEQNRPVPTSTVRMELKLPNVTPKPETSAAQANTDCQEDVLLKTELVRVYTKNKKHYIVARLLYDDGCQRSYATSRTTSRIKSYPVGQEFARNVLFDGSVTEFKENLKHEITIESMDGSRSKKLLIREKPVIGGIVPRIPQGPWLQELAQKGAWLSDQTRSPVESPDIDILIGSDYWGSIMTGRMIHLKCGLTAMQTIFGWTLSGPVPKSRTFGEDIFAMFNSEERISELWSLEALGIRDPIEVKTTEEEEVAAKQLFMETVDRNEEGRYSVRLPWVDGVQKLPNNKNIAESRLLSTSRKLKINDKFEDYDSIFKSWMEEGIVESLSIAHLEDENCHYLPHHPVFKESLTTPVRPVFDASCKTKRNPSLYECLHKGPNMMEEIPTVYMRFREKKIGVLSDIRKAFQMIDVKEEDRDFLRFLWWEDASQKKLKIFRHKRVVFGVSSSPFLLAAVIDMHLKSVHDDRKEIAEKLWKSLYVDNCVTSVDSYKEYAEFKETSTQSMAEAQMDLRQWECSSGEATGIDQLSSSWCGLGAGRNELQYQEQASTSTMVLGLIWDKENDTLSCDFNIEHLPEKVTKRSILSILHKVYDPIGFLSPALLQPKLVLQTLWDIKIGWDKELPEDMILPFRRWFEELHHLKSIKIPRQMMKNKSCKVELHTFCDASQDAYAAVVFVRSEDEDGIKVQLVQAKARVSPLKKPTINRLELMSCLIGMRLTLAVKKALDLETVTTVYWSDSSTALAWIKRNDSWGTFIGNRVREILTFSSSRDWRHVPGVLNPADLPSRGCSPKKLYDSKWWEGPQWLKNSSESWPNSESVVDEKAVNIEKKITEAAGLNLTSRVEDSLEPRFSSYRQNVSVQGWIFRFVDNNRQKKAERLGISSPGSKRALSSYLTVAEMRKAETFILGQIQEESFTAEYIKSMGIKVERRNDGLFHVKTALLNRQDSESFKFPILLPKSHPLVDRLIRDVHIMHGHAGTQCMMGILREKYWILQERRTINKVIHACTKCKRFQVKRLEVETAALPEKRVETGDPFQTTGVDLAGPLYLKDGSKAWVLLFTCAVYRGVHLDLVTSLSTEAFLEALERFINLYGRPNTVYSDNGTNFVGAVNLMKKLDAKEVEKSFNMRQINWIFNPPTAAWWGG